MAGKRRKRRRIGTKDTYGKTIWIYTNGEGEQCYFNSIPSKRNINGVRGLTVKAMFKNKDPLALVKKTIREFENRKNKERFISEKYIVFDKANFDCYNAINLAIENGFDVAFSNPSFEVWICYHFSKSLSKMNQEQALKKAEELMAKHLDYEYKKLDENLYTMLQSKLQNAINNAKTTCTCLPGQNIVDKNPYTGIFKIFDAIEYEKHQ